MEIKAGLTGEAEVAVGQENTAKTLGSGDLEVFATPAMIALMEKAATKAVEGYLPQGSSSVGTLLNIKHMAATPVGMKVSAKATLTAVEDRKLVFTVEAFDEKDKIGEGQHERFIINVDKFMTRVNGKF